MIVNAKRRWVYVGAPKTGSSTLHCLLAFPPFNGVASECQHDSVPPDESYRTFISVRNPYSRAVSLYSHYQKIEGRQLGFEEFLRLLLGGSATGALRYHQTQAAFYRGLRADAMIRLESIHFNLHELQLVGEPFIVPWENRLTDVAWQWLYEDRRLLGLVRDWAGEDFERYGYST